jgi:hypothetical protein
MDMQGVSLYTVSNVDVQDPLFSFVPDCPTSGTGMKKMHQLTAPFRYRNSPVPDGDVRCRIVDAGSINLDADTQLWHPKTYLTLISAERLKQSCDLVERSSLYL